MIQFCLLLKRAPHVGGWRNGRQIATFSIGQHKKWFCFNALRLFLSFDASNKVTNKCKKIGENVSTLSLPDSSAKFRGTKYVTQQEVEESQGGGVGSGWNDQTGAAPPASIEWRSTDFGNNSGASAFRLFFHHFFLFFYEFIKFSWKTLSDLIFFVFIATASGFRIPAQKK